MTSALPLVLLTLSGVLQAAQANLIEEREEEQQSTAQPLSAGNSGQQTATDLNSEDFQGPALDTSRSSLENNARPSGSCINGPVTNLAPGAYIQFKVVVPPGFVARLDDTPDGGKIITVISPEPPCPKCTQPGLEDQSSATSTNSFDPPQQPSVPTNTIGNAQYQEPPQVQRGPPQSTYGSPNQPAPSRETYPNSGQPSSSSMNSFDPPQQPSVPSNTMGNVQYQDPQQVQRGPPQSTYGSSNQPAASRETYINSGQMSSSSMNSFDLSQQPSVPTNTKVNVQYQDVQQVQRGPLPSTFGSQNQPAASRETYVNSYRKIPNSGPVQVQHLQATRSQNVQPPLPQRNQRIPQRIAIPAPQYQPPQFQQTHSTLTDVNEYPQQQPQMQQQSQLVQQNPEPQMVSQNSFQQSTQLSTPAQPAQPTVPLPENYQKAVRSLDEE